MSADNVLAALWRRRVTFLATFAVTLAAAAAVTFSLPKVYSTVAYLLVSPSQTAGSEFERTQVSQALIKTYAELIQTRNVADAVARALPFPSSGRELERTLQVSPVAESQLLEITAEGPSPERAQTIANAYAEVFIARSGRRVAAAGSAVSVAEPAPLVTAPSRPRPDLYLLVGAALAIAAGAAAALLRERLDQSIPISSTTTEVFGLSILARVPAVSSKALAPTIGASHAMARARVDEAFRLLIANLTFVGLDGRPRTVAVVSAGEGEGKSTCALNLTREAAALGMEVLLVEADVRRPRLLGRLGLEGEPGTGLTGALSRSLPLEQVRLSSPSAGVSVLPAGPLPPNPAALLSSPAMSALDREARDRFDLVVYDTPPVAVGADASVIAARADAVILVIDAGHTSRAGVSRAIDQLRRAQATLLGVVVNRSEDSLDADYSYYVAPAEHNGDVAVARSA